MQIQMHEITVLPDIKTASSLTLLEALIGPAQAKSQYRGSLRPFFAANQHTELPTLCAVARELVKRWLQEQLREPAIFNTPATVKDYLRLHFAGYERESFAVMYFDAQLRLIDVEEIFHGTLRQIAIYPREVVKAALRRNASSVVLSHNHPSGHAEPSRAGVDITSTLKLALGLVDVRVMDHIVVGAGGCVSLAERGLL